MLTAFPKRAGKRSRRGIQTLEAVIAFPVIIIATMSLFEFGAILTVHHAVAQAAIEAAREAAKYATPADVETVVEDVLGVHGLTVAVASGVRLIIQDSSGLVAGGDRGDTTIGPAPAGATAAGTVKVTVRVDMDTAPVPNVLKTFGFDIADGDYYEICSLARFE